MDRWIKSALLAAFLLLCAGLSLPAAAQTIDDATDAEVVAAMEARSDLGTSAPDLYGLDISGVPVSLDNLRGKWVYVDFWATWCKPCMKELPSVVKLSRDLQERDDFAVVGVSLDSEQTYSSLKKTVSKARIGYPVIYDGEGANDYISDAWGVQLIPSTFLIDPQGRIAARDLSPSSVKQFISLSGGQGSGKTLQSGSGKPSKNSKTKPPVPELPSAGTAKGSKSGKGGKNSKTSTPSAGSGDTAGSAKPAPMAPISIRSSEQLLGESPSTGRGDMRDLEIHFSMPKGSRAVTRYQIYISAAAATQQDPASRFNWLYDISVASGTADARVPYEVSIQESSGKGYNEVVSMNDVKQMGGLDSATAVSGKLLNLKSNDTLRNPSDILVALDEQRREYQIIVPVPQATSQLRYAIAVYDEQLKEYVRNGLVQVDIS